MKGTFTESRKRIVPRREGLQLLRESSGYIVSGVIRTTFDAPSYKSVGSGILSYISNSDMLAPVA